LEASRNIKNRFSEKLKNDFKYLDLMEQDLQRALKSILVVLKSKTSISSKVNDLLHQKKQKNLLFSKPSQFQKESFDELDLTRFQPKDLLVTTNIMNSKSLPETLNMEFCSTYTKLDIKFFEKNSWNKFQRNEERYHSQVKQFIVIDVKNDGSCQYRALSHQIYGSEEAHTIVRLLTMNEILSNSSLYESFVASKGMEIQEYVAMMSKETHFGDCIL